MDDLWRLRLRRDAFLPPDPALSAGGPPAFVGKVTSTGTALAVGQFVLVNPTDLTGAETESGAGTLTADTAKSIPVYALGPAAPATGDYLVCRYVNYRWVAEKPSPAGTISSRGGSIPGCFCNPSPTTITMTSTDTSCNYGSFQNCTIVWGPTPSEYAGMGLPANGYFSNESFPDSTAGGALFRYHLTCTNNVWSLNQLYASYPGVGQVTGSSIYSWNVGTTSNTCTPFNLAGGTPAPGYNTCTTLNPVTLTE